MKHFGTIALVSLSALQPKLCVVTKTQGTKAHFGVKHSETLRFKNPPPTSTHSTYWLIATHQVKVCERMCSVYVCVFRAVRVCLLNPRRRKDVVYCVQQLHAGSNYQIIIHDFFFFFFLSPSLRCTLRTHDKLSQCLSLVACFVAFTMFPRVIMKGTLIKKSQQKKRTSPCNYKERMFILDTQDLKYSERRPGVSSFMLFLNFKSYNGLGLEMLPAMI